MSVREFVMSDLKQRYSAVEIPDVCLRLYPNIDEALQRAFANLHDRLCALLDHMNYKRNAGGHYNAEESRELLRLIEEIGQMRADLKRAGIEVKVDDYYAELLTGFTTWVVRSGGSPIPQDVGHITIPRYDPIFSLPDTVIHLEKSQQSFELRSIGEGAFATVHRYKDPDYGFYVAVKKARRDLEERDLERFKSEYKILRSMSFPYVLQVYGYDDAKNSYSMEYCDSTLKSFIEKHNAKLPFGTRKRIALQFLYGLNYLHRKEILHRDISYNNVLIKQYEFMAVMVKISDFGLHKDAKSDFTRADTQMKGTIQDPSLDSFKEYAVENEIYSIGMLLSFIFSGRLAVGNCGALVNAIVARCVHSDPAERYPDVMSVISEVEALEVEPLSNASETPA